MKLITLTTPPIVTVPWGRKKDLPRALLERAYETCQAGNKAHCINTNLVRAWAEHQGRTIRFPRTYKGELRWSELVNGLWFMFAAGLTASYAGKIDNYDATKQRFRPPTKCPMGPVRCLGLCHERRDLPEVRKDRLARLNARITAGNLIPGARMRAPLLPFVLARMEKQPSP